jgi:glutamine cyclotransferase
MNTTTAHQPAIQTAEIVREYGPFNDSGRVAGVTYDGRSVWAATGEKLVAFDPATGDAIRTLDATSDAGTRRPARC